ncbi:MAG: hypothetical protein AAGA54_25225 [Myxococcota bacterium]
MPQERTPPRPVTGAHEALGAVGSVLRREAKSALARWALHKRRNDGTPAQWTSQDEATHAWDGRKRFAEDYTFIAVQADLAVLVRLEWLPGRAAHRIWLAVLRDGGTWVLGDEGQLIVREAGTDRWRAGGLEIDCVKPLQRWHVRFKGSLRRRGTDEVAPARVDLTFLADDDPFSPGVDDDPELVARRIGEASWDRQLLRAVRRDHSRGYAQSGSFTGTLAIADMLVPIRASAARQHTWGVRDWGAPDLAFLCFAAWDDGRRAMIHRAAFPFVTLEGGYLRAPGGTRQLVRGLGITTEARLQGAPAHLDASLDLATQPKPLSLRLETLRDVAFTVDGRGEFSFGLCRLGEGEGWGVWAGQRRTLRRPGADRMLR